ncbi:hypothetical protein [Candidatus Nitrosocosmicus franklandus]|uniref:Uncharacterized protein n=1 Tax=Candidatus Nitrosocosmicus franklandianus TaxID=1798806 RepID=A0A484I8Y7_9ARCH|nr:hypothetical protein [Candidatus Nitrosocosmicus franklandus]VFJ12724.1 conserved protein of unknown function [Candidatus Nitrosocosmicus franklandus]
MELSRGKIRIWKESEVKKILIVKMIMTLGLLTGTSFINSGLALEIIQQEMVQDENGFLHLIGLAQNNENKTLKNIYVIGTLIGSNKTPLANYSNQVEVDPLNPSEKTAYDIMIYDKDQNDLIHDYSIAFTANFSNSKNIKNLEIHSLSSRYDLLGFFYISGRVTNEMDSISNNTIVIAAISDEDQNLLGIWKAQTEPYNIPPSATASFTIPITDNTQTSKIANYTLFVNNS